MSGAMSRELAATLAHTTCPRCGTPRLSSQAYCVDCGLRLPIVAGGVARLRRSWLRGLGWYPGDWIWPALAGLVLASAGAAGSLVLNRDRAPRPAGTVVAAAPAPVSASPGVRGANGRTVWPARLDGWTVVLASEPSAKGPKGPRRLAAAAARRGLLQVGVLDSSAFGSLHPGYFVVFSGAYGTPGDAQIALQTAQDRGYGAAYVLRVAA